MKFGVLVLDYDGTTEHNHGFHPEVRAAIQEARSAGITVVLATGRILQSLRQELIDLTLLDAVVAENGAVLLFPDTGRSSVLGRPPAPAFLEALKRRNIDIAVGECVVEADANAAPQILQVIREMELPLVLLFNRGRVMVLPQSISKATGLNHALNALRLSSHNALAIGDAENDFEMLQFCEVGVAVGWGSRALQASADQILPGDGPSAVAAYIRRTTGCRRLPPVTGRRRQLLLGSSTGGGALVLPSRGQNILIAGDPKSGKSWVAGVLCEQLILQRYCVCVIDPEGDYAPLERLPGVLRLGIEEPLPKPRDIARALRYPDNSLVIDLSEMMHERKVEYVTALLPVLAALRGQFGLPHRILVDEAHYFLHGPDGEKLIDMDLAGYLLVSYRASKLAAGILRSTEAIIVTRETDPDEVRALETLSGLIQPAERLWGALLGGLALNEAVFLPRPAAVEGALLHRFRIAPRLTPNVRHRHEYLDMPVPPGRAFLFTYDGASTGLRAESLRAFTRLLASAPGQVVAGHLQKKDFSRWIAEVFGDRLLAGKVEDLERQFQLGRSPDVIESLVRLIHERYDVADGEDGVCAAL